MSKRFTIGLLIFFAGVAGNLVAGWLQQGRWAIQPTTEQFLGTLAGAGLFLFVVALLESERALAWNWRWHRFWYLRELLKNPDLRHWEKDFARLEMVQGRRKTFGAEVIAEGKRQDMVEVLRELIIGRQEKTPRALVLGEPGSGKTTGLERLTLDLAHAGLRRFGISCKIPVLLRLGNFQQGTLLDFAAQKMEQATKRSSGEILSKGIKKLIKQGRVVLLCDALDEALGSRRDLVLAELKNFLEDHAYQDVPIVITSRTREDPGSGLKGLTAFEIQDLSDEAVNVFIRAYKRPEHSETEITQRLQNHRLLEPGGLGRNPFWLRLIVASGAFAGNKGQILNTAVDTLLAREWDEKPAVERSWRRVLPRDEQLEETKRALAFLGYWMSSANLVTIEQDGALMALEKGWLTKREQAGVKGLRPQDILGLGRDAQVLVYDPGPIRFRHRLLQEFMTAWMLMVDEELREKEIERCAQDTGWWEILFLLGGLLGSNRPLGTYGQFVQHVLGDGTNDKRLFPAIGLLRSVKNPPTELANTVTTRFLESVDEKLTSEQVFAAQELGDILGDEATEFFGAILKNPERRTKAKGVALLCALRSKHADDILLNTVRDKKERDVVVDAFVSIGALAVEPLIAALKESDGDVRSRAAKALGEIGDLRAMEPLVAALKESNDEVRSSAAKALGEIGDHRAMDPLINALRDSAEWVRWYAAGALGNIGDPRAVEPLITMLKDSDKWSSRRAAEAVEKIGEPAVDPLITMLKHSNISMRRHAAELLGRMGDPRAVEPLTTALKDWHFEVRRHVAEALGNIGDPRAVESLIAALKDSDYDVRKNTTKALIKIGKPAVVPLIATLKDSDIDVRKHAAEALCKIGEPAVEPIIAVVRGLNEWARAYATEALRGIVDLRAVEIVRLKDSEDNLDWYTAEALGNIGGPRAVEPLIAALKKWSSRHAIEVFVEKIGRPAVEPLIAALKDSDDNLGWYAARALGKIGKPVIGPLIAVLKDSDIFDVRNRAVYALCKIGEPAIDPLIVALKDSNELVRSHAAQALASIGDPRALPELERVAREDKDIFLGRSVVAEMACAAIKKIRQHMAESQR